jgi:hypothetical protein
MATEIISRLNLRIRLSYACVQLISPSLAGQRLALPFNAILICERIAPLNRFLLYYSPRVDVAFRYGQSVARTLEASTPAVRLQNIAIHISQRG